MEKAVYPLKNRCIYKQKLFIEGIKSSPDEKESNAKDKSYYPH